MRGDLAATALLDAPSLIQDACCVCGMPATNNHHVVPKGLGGMSGTEGPRVSLCGMGNASGCHRLAHGMGLTFGYDKGGWYFTAAIARAVDDINTRRHISGLWDVYSGANRAYVAPDFDCCDVAPAESIGEKLTAISERIAEANDLSGTLAYAIGVSLTEARSCFAAMYGGKRDAQQAFREWYTDTLGYSKSQVSKHEAFATLPASAADLGISRGYLVAKAVRDGLADEAEAIESARALSVSDLRATYWPREESPDAKVACPIDAADCPRRWKRGERDE